MQLFTVQIQTPELFHNLAKAAVPGPEETAGLAQFKEAARRLDLAIRGDCGILRAALNALCRLEGFQGWDLTLPQYARLWCVVGIGFGGFLACWFENDVNPKVIRKPGCLLPADQSITREISGFIVNKVLHRPIRTVVSVFAVGVEVALVIQRPRQLIEDRRGLLCETAVPEESVRAFDTSLDRCRDLRHLDSATICFRSLLFPA